MQENPHDIHEAAEHIDADAVCEACGHVNPEGTLLCKMCGNNLRDQRARRMKAGGPIIKSEPVIHIGRIVRGVVILFGIGTVLWAAFNVSTIESWLLSGVQSVEAKGQNIVDPKSFWIGPDAAHYAELTATLDQHKLTIDDASAVPPGAPQASLDGLYVLKRSPEATVSPLGMAAVKTVGDTIYFSARLAGGTEIRGSAEKSSDTIIQAYNIGVLDPDGTYTDAYGIAQVSPTGEVRCSGFFGDGDQEMPANVVAIPIVVEGTALPSPATGAATDEAGAAPAEPASSSP